MGTGTFDGLRARTHYLHIVFTLLVTTLLSALVRLHVPYDPIDTMLYPTTFRRRALWVSYFALCVSAPRRSEFNECIRRSIAPRAKTPDATSDLPSVGLSDHSTSSVCCEVWKGRKRFTLKLAKKYRTACVRTRTRRGSDFSQSFRSLLPSCIMRSVLVSHSFKAGRTSPWEWKLLQVRRASPLQYTYV